MGEAAGVWSLKDNCLKDRYIQRSRIIMQSLEKNTAAFSGKNARMEPLKLMEQIGSTSYMVNIHFNENSKETLEEVILRLIMREVINIA